jgi:hypothetical protein
MVDERPVAEFALLLLKIRSRKFLIQSRSFGELLEATLREYRNRSIEAAQVVEELSQSNISFGLTEDELTEISTPPMFRSGLSTWP